MIAQISCRDEAIARRVAAHRSATGYDEHHCGDRLYKRLGTAPLAHKPDNRSCDGAYDSPPVGNGDGDAQ